MTQDEKRLVFLDVERLVFLDVETTGLDPDRDVILEVAALVVSPFLTLEYPTKSSFHRYVHFLDCTEEVVNRMAAPLVVTMHRDSGLIADAEQDRQTHPELAGGGHSAVESALIDWLSGRGFAPGTAVLAGSGVHFDRSFIRRKMPRLDSFLHYRMLDVTALREAYRRWVDEKYEKPTPKHRAQADIEAALGELRIFRDRLVR